MVKRLLALVVVIVLLLIAGLLTGPDLVASRWTPCSFGDFECVDPSFDDRQDSFSATLRAVNEVIISDLYLWSDTTFVECWQNESELHLTADRKKERILMSCTPFEKEDISNKLFNLNASYRGVNSTAFYHETAWLVYYEKTLLSRLPTGAIFALLVYLTVTVGLFGGIMKDRLRRERLLCLGWGVLGSLGFAGVVIGVFILGGVLVGRAVLFLVIALLLTQGLAPYFIPKKVKHRALYGGVMKYALMLGLMHLFVFFIWYFGILTPT